MFKTHVNNLLTSPTRTLLCKIKIVYKYNNTYIYIYIVSVENIIKSAY